MLQANRITGLIPDIEDGYGVVFTDLNQDRYPDIYQVCFINLNRLLVNNGGIIPFIDRTIKSGLGGNLMPRGKSNLEVGAAAGDYDNDGLPDIFLSGWGKTIQLYHNLGEFEFEAVGQRLNLPGNADANQAIWFDADNDGYLDLFLTDEHYYNRLMINRRNGEFQESVWQSQTTVGVNSQGAVAADLDNDRDLDLYICHWFAPDELFINNGFGYFEKANLPLPTLLTSFTSNMVTAADFDTDGDLDLCTGSAEGKIFLYFNETDSTGLHFRQSSDLPFDQVNGRIYSLIAEDFNQDTFIDLFIATTGDNRIYSGIGQGNFDPDFDSDRTKQYSTGASIDDLDRDGDPDLVVANKKNLTQVFLNPVNSKKYLQVKTEGLASNRDGIGARLELYDNDTGRLIGVREVSTSAGYFSARSNQVFFGTGQTQNLRLIVKFPSGKDVVVKNLIPGRRITVRESSRLLMNLLRQVHYAGQYYRKPGFLVEFTLLLLILIVLIFYLRIGILRYEWSVFTTTLHLIFWLFLIVSIQRLPFKVNIRSFETGLLLAISGGAMVSLLYSEYHSRRLSRHRSFREDVRQFGRRVLMLHEQDKLYTLLLRLIRKMPSCSDVLMLIHESDEVVYNFEQTGADQKMTVKFPQLNPGNPGLIHWRSEDGPWLGVNLMIPVTIKDKVAARLALKTERPHEQENQEDLNQVLTVMNLVSIALQNIEYIEQANELTRKLTESEVKKAYLEKLEASNIELDLKNQELNRLFNELQQKEAQLIHSEKMASLGQLVAGISHELNNPISFLYANMHVLEQQLAAMELWLKQNTNEQSLSGLNDILNDIREVLQDNRKGSLAVKEIVQNLKNFSRLDQADWKISRIAEGIQSSIKILQPQIGPDITLETNIETDPEIYCNPGQLNQVFVNIIANALDSMNGSGRLSIRVFSGSADLFIEFCDTGKGIPGEIQSRIFDPFFTTKPVDRGTGLGLSVSYSIIKNHGGEIKVHSKEGQGACFLIRLPLNPEKINAG